MMQLVGVHMTECKCEMHKRPIAEYSKFIVDIVAAVEDAEGSGRGGQETDSEYVTVAVRFSSVTPLSVSTTEMYPSRRAMERAVFPFCHTHKHTKLLYTICK